MGITLKNGHGGVLALGLGAMFALFLPQLSFAAEQIPSFAETIKVNADSSLDVTEQISYDFDDAERHGLFRDIPYKYKRDGANYNLRISDITVTDEAGSPYQFTTSKSGGELEIKIGNPDTLVTGSKTYILHYHVVRALNYFSDHDELYWNVTGNEWQVPMANVLASVSLPGDIDQANIQFACFAGLEGSTALCDEAQITQGQVVVSQKVLQPSEGLTVVVGWLKGAVTPLSSVDNLRYWLQDNAIFFLPLLGIIAIFALWYHKGRDPKSKIPVVAQYEAPDSLTPIEAGYLADGRNQTSKITAEIIYLAVMGYLRIERLPKAGWLGKDDFKLIRLKSADEHLTDFDHKLMDLLLPEERQELQLSDFKKKKTFARKNFDLKSISKHLAAAGYYAADPSAVRTAYIIAAVVLLASLWIIGGMLSLPAIIALVGVALAILGFGLLMPKMTQKGADTRQLVLGLKEYLSVAEQARLDFHNDPAKDPKLFDKLLPYALALGVSKQWAKKFEGLLDAQPSWYSDPGHANFSAIYFASSLSDFNSNFSSVVNQNSSTAGHGGSGFSGGGSGGGFGGGGGGSW